MTILITGINGRIGQYVAKGLLNKGYKVIGLDKSDTICESLKGCPYIRADITNKYDIDKALGGLKVNTAIHLAALAHVPSSSNISLEEFMKINCEGALNIAHAVHECGVKKMLLASTVDVYGEVNSLAVNENTPCKPVTNYGKSKYAAEKKLELYLASVGIDYYVFRFTPVYLPEYTFDLDKRVLLPKKLGAFYFNNGNQKLSLCSIYNIVESVVAFAEEKLNPGMYIISDKETLSAKEIANMKKQTGEVKNVFRLTYSLTFVLVSVFSWMLEILGKSKEDLLVNSLNKLAKPVNYDSSKISKIIELGWHIQNTLMQFTSCL